MTREKDLKRNVKNSSKYKDYFTHKNDLKKSQKKRKGKKTNQKEKKKKMSPICWKTNIFLDTSKQESKKGELFFLKKKE